MQCKTIDFDCEPIDRFLYDRNRGFNDFIGLSTKSPMHHQNFIYNFYQNKSPFFSVPRTVFQTEGLLSSCFQLSLEQVNKCLIWTCRKVLGKAVVNAYQWQMAVQESTTGTRKPNPWMLFNCLNFEPWTGTSLWLENVVSLLKVIYPVTAWFPLKGHTYLSKPVAFTCRFFLSMWDFLVDTRH